MTRHIRFNRTTVIGWCLLWVLFGLGFARIADDWNDMWVVLAVLFLLGGFRTGGYALLFSLIFCAFLVGWWRGSVMLASIAPYGELYGQKVVVRITADTDAVYNERKQLEFDAVRVEMIDPYQEDLPGRIRVSGFGIPAVFRGDQIQVEGKMYKARGSRQAGISFGEMVLIEREQSGLERIRLRFVAGMQTSLPEPLASFAAGLLVGQRSNLPKRVNDDLATVGLTHIIAVSGYNLTIIMQAVRKLLHKGSKYQITLFSLFLMAAFLFVTGFSASIVRAALVSTLSLWAWYYGRTIRPLVLIMVAAVLTAIWNPLYLWSDIGWYLSFLAFFGVLIISPAITGFLYGSREPKLIAGVTIESGCAQIMTVPLILWIFQRISIVAPVSNLLIVPMVPLAMLFSLIAGLAGMILPMLAGWFAWPARILLTYMLDIVSIIASMPYAQSMQALSLAGMLATYGIIGVLTVVLWRKAKNRRVTITDTDTKL